MHFWERNIDVFEPLLHNTAPLNESPQLQVIASLLITAGWTLTMTNVTV